MNPSSVVKRFTGILLLVCAFAALAEDPHTAAIARLSGVDVFAFGGVGIAGQTSKGEIDFRLVLSQPLPVALTAFEKLYATGNPQARSYALFGLRKIKPSRFKELLTSAEASKDKVDVMRGCIITHELLRDVAKQIDSGVWDAWFALRS
jgi:hypothetical protein